jgi:integrase
VGQACLFTQAAEWVPLQDVGPSTECNREYLIRRFLKPAWGNVTLSAVTTEAITRWENSIPAKEGVSQRTARDVRSLLGTILGDAAAHKPPLIPYNPALRPRNRGRKTGRRLARSPQRAWATPLQALLLAERAALLAGRDDEFTMILTYAYTGLRFAELLGLEHAYLHPGEIRVEWQLHEIGGRLHRLSPKDDSYRSPDWEPCLPVDLPPFLGALLTRQAQKQRQRCPCAATHGGSGKYVFLSPDGRHCYRSNYARRILRPACDGRYPPANGIPGKLIIVDATTWPGVPIAAWPTLQPGSPDKPGTTQVYTQPRGRGIQVIPQDTPLSCWLTLGPKLTTHGLRHGHRTWMAEDGIPDILAERRLGHEVPACAASTPTSPTGCAPP